MGRATQILRAVTLLLCGFSVVLAVMQPTAVVGHGAPLVALDVILTWTLSPAQGRLIGICVPLIIAALFWRCTSTSELDSPSRMAIVLLAIQTLLAFLVAEELQFVVAIEAGLLLAPRSGALWVAVQALAAWAISTLHPELMSWALPATGDRRQRLVSIAVFMLIAMLYNFLAYSLGLLAGMEGRQRRALAMTCGRLEEANQQLLAAQRTLTEAARTEERLNLARDLHDAIGHQLSALSIHLQIASRISRDEARKHVVEAYQLAGVLLSDVRSVVTATRDKEPQDLQSALQMIADRVPTPSIHLNVDPLPPMVHGSTVQTLFRCSQEVITNAVRHANASNIWIEIKKGSDAYYLTAWDDGVGNREQVLGNGLRGIEERSLACGGACTFRNRPGAGFEVALSIPSCIPEAA